MNELLRSAVGRRALLGYAWVMLVFLLAPAVLLIPLSFSDETSFTFPPPAYSMHWYHQLVEEPRWQAASLLSFQIALLASILATALGVPASIAMSRVSGRANRFMKLLFISPMIVPLMVIGVGFYTVFAQFGLLGTRFSLILAHTVLVLPFIVLPITGRLLSIDPVLERAAASLGAGPYRTLARIILPLLGPAIAAGFVFSFIFSFDEVVVAQFLSGPALETLPRLMWEGISTGGLDKTITAVTTVQIAIAVLLVASMALWQRRRWRALAMSAANAAVRLENAGIRPLAQAATSGSSPPGSAKLGGGAPRGDNGTRGVGIAFEHLTKRYGKTAAVADLSLTIAPGEFVTVLGPSGSGKTTLLMLVAGFISPDAGRLVVGGRDISVTPPHKRDIGVVFQNYALFPHLDVRRNVAFPLEARGIARDKIARRVDWALSRVQMTQYGQRRINQLSGGQQQRVALARAIVFDPCALLMDEPLAALDRNLRVEMQNEIRTLQRSLGQTVIYVTHDQEEALNLSDRVAVMSGGRLQQIDTPKDLYLKPRNSFVASFFGEANLLRGTAAGAVLTTAAGIGLPLPAPRRGPTVLCVRPEVMRMDAPPGGDFPAIEGRVAETRFQGSIVRLRIETPLGTMTVIRQINFAAAIPPTGAAVRLSWEPQHSHAMDDDV